MSKLTLLCKNQPCWLKIPHVCQGKKETVVPCHSPDYERMHGKGFGIKPHDIFTAPGCVDCHDYIDDRRDSHLKLMNTTKERQYFWNKGHAAWLTYLFESHQLGVLK